jgi:molybdopterin molybdotransferase
VAELGELPVHGVALRPASPAGLGSIGGTPVLLMPGNPVSCLCAYDFFAGRVVRRLGGRPPDWPYPRAAHPLAQKLVSALGRVDYARVKVVDGKVEPAGHQRRVDPLEHHPRRRVRRRPGRPRRVSGRGDGDGLAL